MDLTQEQNLGNLKKNLSNSQRININDNNELWDEEIAQATIKSIIQDEI